MDPVPYDNSSLHYSTLHFFDDMVRKITEEKEIWPGIKLEDHRKDSGGKRPKEEKMAE
jgi:hypothetical protein